MLMTMHNHVPFMSRAPALGPRFLRLWSRLSPPPGHPASSPAGKESSHRGVPYMRFTRQAEVDSDLEITGPRGDYPDPNITRMGPSIPPWTLIDIPTLAFLSSLVLTLSLTLSPFFLHVGRTPTSVPSSLPTCKTGPTC